MIITMLSTVVFAATVEEEEADMIRIYEDMKKFEKRGNWSAVEKKYQELLSYKKASPTMEMHVLAAQASNAVGDVGKTRIRLERALAVQADPKTQGWLDSINSSFVRVEISVSNDYDSPPELLIKEMPFFPDQQQAIAFAQKSLAENGKFKGMLPFGEYTMASTTFSLQQTNGAEVQKIKVAESMSIGPIVPRFDLGLSAANAGASTEVNQAAAFNGFGTRIGVGVSAGLNDKFGALAQIGYHGAFGGGEDLTGSALPNFGSEAVPTRYNAGYAWLAGQMKLSSIDLSVGPIFELASIQTQGFAEYDYAVAKGTVLSSGVSAGLTYYGFSLGDAFDGGITTQFGLQSDSARWYSWGQVAFTMNGRKK